AHEIARGEALRLAGGSSLRIDVGTRVRLVSSRERELESGAVYLDSDGAAASSPPLEVATPLGRVTEIGTRFEVRLDAAERSGLDVRVRDGRVVLAEDSKAHEIARGEALRLGADGETERRSIDPRGAEWDWALAAAPVPEIEGRTLVEFLAWLERETGWAVRFEDAGLAERAAGIRLHGSVEGLAPLEAAEVVLAGAGLEHRLEERTLRIRRR
ncbi:MAG TPA: FecR domain-containing protein, partial [Thermoanaerobaculia bacterium]|nr:FecR domain-containing protein [Thermoanaerobaculia bacterium]